MDALTLSNVAAYSAQVACIVAIAGMASWLLRIDAAVVRYACWRAVLGLCLVLPILQGRQVQVANDGLRPITSSMVAATDVDSPPPARSRPTGLLTVPLGALFESGPAAGLVFAIMAMGTTARAAWIGVSLFRLRRLRRLGERAAFSDLHEELQDTIGTRCEIRHVAALRQPVTFGFRRPVILLPASLTEQPPEIQRAVLSHELFHVKRGDWAWLLFEEGVCALLWFNPAVWWMVSRLHLARELVVDELAVLATGRRRTYVEALITFADDTSLAPVAAFGGRRQLFNRIVLLSKEAGMSSRRVVVTGAVVVALLATVTWRAVSAFPLTAPAANTPSTVPVQDPVRVGSTIAQPRKVYDVKPIYPAVAQAARVAGVVVLEVRVGVDGTVEEATVLRSVPLLDDAAVDAAMQWRFTPTLLNGRPVPVIMTHTVNFSLESRQVRDLPPPPPPAPARSRGMVRPGMPPPPPPAPQQEVSVVQTPVVLKRVHPAYPVDAMAAGIQGTVELEVIIGPEGTVRDARVTKSIAELDEAAVAAIREWKFKPFTGDPVRRTLELSFTLRRD